MLSWWIQRSIYGDDAVPYYPYLVVFGVGIYSALVASVLVVVIWYLIFLFHFQII